MTGIPVGRIPRQEALVLPEPHWGAASIRRLSVQIQEEGFMAKWGSAGVSDSFIRDLTDTIPSEVKLGWKVHPDGSPRVSRPVIPILVPL